MSKVLERLRKKRGHKVTIDNEDVYVRSLTIGESRRADALDKDLRTGFIIGCTLCDGEDGTQSLPPNDGESDATWAARVLEALADVPTDAIIKLSNGVAAIGKPVTLEAIAKN